MGFDFTNKSDREKAHEIVKKIIEDHKYNLNLELTVNALKTIEELIETQERIIEDQEERIAIMTEGGFVPISRKKPPYDKDVLLFLKNGGYFVGHRKNSWGQDIYCDGEMGSGCVFPTHWMELPEPPKEGETE